MGILVDFQEASKALLEGKKALSPSTELADAINQFAFAQLAKRNRIALVLAGIFEGEAEDYLTAADEIEFYAKSDFTVPYSEPKTVGDVTLGDVIS